MNHDIRYLPFITGNYSTAPGLRLLSNNESSYDSKVFQIDDKYHDFLGNASACRIENIDKYYMVSNLPETTINAVNRYFVDQLNKEYPNYFIKNENSLENRLTEQKIVINEDKFIENEPYLSLFDALCCQVQEDIAVFQLTNDTDYLSAIHLCAPNHWSPADKIGKPFDTIHQPVAEMEKTLKNYRIMLESIVKKEGSFTRFAWGLATDDRLNHHPEPPPLISHSDWHGRSQKPSDLYLRVERQNLIGFPAVSAFMFTIRTYHYRVDELTTFEKSKLREAIDSMTEATKKYKGIDQMMSIIDKATV